MKRITIHEVTVEQDEAFTLADNQIIIHAVPAYAGPDKPWCWRVTYITESKE